MPLEAQNGVHFCLEPNKILLINNLSAFFQVDNFAVAAEDNYSIEYSKG